MYLPSHIRLVRLPASYGVVASPLAIAPCGQGKTVPHRPAHVLLDLHRFRGLFETENSARKGEHCHEQTRPTHQNFAEKLSGWLELPMRSILSLGSPVRLVSPTVPLGVG